MPGTGSIIPTIRQVNSNGFPLADFPVAAPGDITLIGENR
jgi:hypothetical protein